MTAAPSRSLHLRSAIGGLGREILAAARSDQRIRTPLEGLALALIVAIPMLATAIALAPEVTMPVPSVNDDMLHYLFITNASNVLSNGGNLIDHWLPHIDLGLPQFLFYQHLPHLAVIGLQRLTLDAVDLLTVFNLVRYVLLVAFPLTVFWSMRQMGFSPVAAALSAAVASLLSGGQRYGFEYDSYVWRGWGMYTQLWAMHLSFITLACVYTALNSGRRMALAVIAFSALVLSHLVYAYMMAITILVVLLVGMNRANAPTRVVRLAIIGGLAAVITSYMWLPFAGAIPFDNATPYLQPYKYDSFGAEQILSWLVSGQLFDVDRLPVLTFLLAVGILAVLVARRRPAVLVLVLFGIWLVLYFGRPSVAFLVDLLPLHDSLLLHRFVGSVDIAAIILMGIGGAWLWALITRTGTPIRLLAATGAALLLITPAIQERFRFYDLNTAWMSRTQVAIDADANAAAIIATLKTLPPGRVFAGLPATWGQQIHDGDVPFYDLLPFHEIVGAPPPTEAMSLNSDYLWDFDDRDPAQYDLYNVRYVVAPTGLAMAEFLKPLQRAGPYTLYEAPTSGYAQFVNIVGWEPVANQEALFTRNRPWVNGNGPAQKNYVAYDYPSNSAVASGRPTPGCPDGGQILSEDVDLERFTFVVNCAVDSPLVIKATYHPNWQVQIDGQPARTFMVSPSNIGLLVPAGQHTITAEYQATPIKTPLLVLGAVALLLTLLLGRRLNRASEAVARPVKLPLGPLPVPGLPPAWRTALRRTPRAAAPCESSSPDVLEPDAASPYREPRTTEPGPPLLASLGSTAGLSAAIAVGPSGEAAIASAPARSTGEPAAAVDLPRQPWRDRIRWPAFAGAVQPDPGAATRLLDRLRGVRLVLLLTAFSLLGAVVAGRVVGPNGPWLWNFDMPFFDYPLAKFFHDALRDGRLPLWNDNLGLGFPLYAEGQISAFYPPNWLIFQLPPLPALDVARVAHLCLLGVGTGLLALRLSGSRLGAFVACGAVVLTGGVVSKLEWTNLIESFAWLPWILLPLFRWPSPTRAGLVSAGLLWGVQALALHPNIWMLTGICAAAVMLAIRPRLDTLPRLVGLGLIAAGVGAIQIIPTALLWSVSLRAEGLDRADLFRLTAMPFDMLGTAFANVFIPWQAPDLNLNLTWYPGGGWSQSEIAAYVGLPALALGATALRVRRARPVVAAGLVMFLLPIIGGLRLDLWAAIPVWNGLHAPVKAYMFLDVMLVLLAAIGIGRLQRGHRNWRPAAAAVALLVAGYVFLTALVLGAPAFFESLVRGFWSWPPADQASRVAGLAQEALSRLWPVVFEVVLGIAAVAVIWLNRGRAATVAAASVLVLLPLVILVPGFNRSLPENQFSYANSAFMQAVAARQPQRVLALDPPVFWSGMPDQLAAAGLPDLDMFASLPLEALVDLRTTLRYADPDHTLARAVGIDTLVSFGSACPGSNPERIPAEGATICDLPDALKPPYWIPATAASVGPDPSVPLVQPTDAQLNVPMALANALPVTTLERSDTTGRFAVFAPSDGWVFIDRSWWPMWQTTVDGSTTRTYRALGGQLLFVGAGHHVIDQSMVPWDVGLGLLVALGTILVAALWAWPKRPTRSSAG